MFYIKGRNFFLFNSINNMKMKIENLEEFLKEISREKLLSCEEELELIKAAQEKGLV